MEVISNQDIHYGITVPDFIKCLARLKDEKSDGLRGTTSDHYIHCSHQFKVYIAILVNAMFVHGYTPSGLIESVVTSIPKDIRGDLCNSDNYRGIALCSALCKLIDIIIIDKYGHLLSTSELQFAFKPEHSTNVCRPYYNL